MRPFLTVWPGGPGFGGAPAPTIPTLVFTDPMTNLSAWTQSASGWSVGANGASTASGDFAGDLITRDTGVALERCEQREQYHYSTSRLPMHWLRQDGALTALALYGDGGDNGRAGRFAAGSFSNSGNGAGSFSAIPWPAGDYDVSVFYLEDVDGLVYGIYSGGTAGAGDPAFATLYKPEGGDPLYATYTGTKISLSGHPSGATDPLRQVSLYKWPAATKVLITDGDSITAFGWPQVLRAIAGYQWGGINFAVSGDNSGSTLSRSQSGGTTRATIVAAKAAGQTVTAILAVGVNDLGGDPANLASLKSNVAATVANYFAAGADFVYVCTILTTQTTDYPTSAADINTASADYNAWISVGSGAMRIDTASWPTLVDPTDTTYFKADDLHPNPRGEHELAKAVQSKLVADGVMGNVPSNAARTSDGTPTRTPNGHFILVS